ncbi:hypothetical protein TRVA0_012S02872 [Trichomonascus vanleenenianus]|uniref:uncharacterized protein n=1 Tax=Trichomonascus vanleenenianus TaxID=2268995 RepID=UPI003ECA8BBF
MEDHYDYEDGNVPYEGETIAVGDVVYDEAQLARQQEALAAAGGDAKAAQIPDAVKEFILYFQNCLHECKVYELHACYESSFNKLTERFYKSAPWPAPEAVAPIVKHDETFLVFYTEVYYRHLYARLQPTLQQRMDSYNNYCRLFSFFLNSSETPSNIELPTYWAWDIIDEFIYQFNSYSIYRNRVVKKNANADEIQQLKSNPETWSAYSVLNVLYSLSKKANMTEQLRAIKRGEDPALVAGEFGSRPLYKMLGYFSIIGLLRVHTFLGDFSLALKSMEDIELNKKALFARVAAAHFTTYYYVGFSYMMLRRYADAIKAFSHILLFISRTKNINRSAQFDTVTKKSEQMYALLAICVTLCPTRLDDVIHTSLREKYGDHLSRMARGGADAFKAFEELFLFGAPKFISPSGPDFENPQNNIDPIQHHLRVFMVDVRNTTLGTTLKSYLNLYATMDIDKLAGFLDTDADKLRSALVTFKMKNRQIKWSSGDLLQGSSTNLSDIDIALEDNLITIAETKGGRKFADWFIRNTGKNFSIQDFIANPDAVSDSARSNPAQPKKNKK